MERLTNEVQNPEPYPSLVELWDLESGDIFFGSFLNILTSLKGTLSSRMHYGKHIFYSQPAEKIKVTQRMLCNFLLSSTSNSGYYHMVFLLGSSLYMFLSGF